MRICVILSVHVNCGNPGSARLGFQVRNVCGNRYRLLQNAITILTIEVIDNVDQ
jgi:hypothetical protein